MFASSTTVLTALKLCPSVLTTRYANSDDTSFLGKKFKVLRNFFWDKTQN
jgi:hypothetical protein